MNTYAPNSNSFFTESVYFVIYNFLEIILSTKKSVPRGDGRWKKWKINVLATNGKEGKIGNGKRRKLHHKRD